MRIEPCWRTSWQQQGRMWCTGLCNGTRRRAGGQQTTRGAGGTEDWAESEHRGSNQKLAPPHRLAALGRCTVERWKLGGDLVRASGADQLTPTDKEGACFSEGRPPGPRSHAPITRAQEGGGGGEHTGAPLGRARTCAKANTATRLPKRMRGRQTDEQGEVGSVHVGGEKAYTEANFPTSCSSP